MTRRLERDRGFESPSYDDDVDDKPGLAKRFSSLLVKGRGVVQV
jgi:hypothetical protein